jgi:hypothetical protein
MGQALEQDNKIANMPQVRVGPKKVKNETLSITSASVMLGEK